jgi:hypothetical protein
MLCYWNVNKAQFYFYLVSILGNLSDLIFVCGVSNQSGKFYIQMSLAICAVSLKSKKKVIGC